MPITTRQWDIVIFVEQFWKENSFFPPTEEIASSLNLDESDVIVELSDPVVLKNFEVRAIDPEITEPQGESNKARRARLNSGHGSLASKQLTDIQLAACHAMLNPLDRRSVKAKLEPLGVTVSQWAHWKKNPNIARYLKQQSADMFTDHMPEIDTALVNEATKGNTRAAQFIYEVTGRYRRGQSDSEQNVKMLIIGLTEILQRHIKDPNVLQAIGNDIQALTNGGQVTAKQFNENNGPESLVAPRPVILSRSLEEIDADY